MSKHRTRGTRWSRLLSGVLCLALTLGLLPSAGLIQPARAEHWADPYGEQLVEWGVMNPSSDLRLGSTVTRAEFVAMCNRAFGYKKLGSMPFVDVPSSAWYAQDINIAYNAGYFQGTATDRASPNGTLTREQAAVLVARNLMLQETVGEVIAFTDSHDLSEWSRGLIGAAVAEGMIGGYEDGSYRPAKSITRGEVAKMLVSVIGTPINKAGRYELGSVYGNAVISSSDVTLRNTVIAGNLYVTGGVDLGNVVLENVTVLGRIVVAGGGESHAGQSSVVLRNVVADELVIDSIIDKFVTVSAYGITNIPVTHVRSDAYLEDESWPGYGLQCIELDGDPRTLLQLAGTIKEVVNKTPFSTLQLAQGTAEKITIDEYARDSELILDVNTRVNELNLDVATLVHGNGDKMGDIGDLNINASGCEVDMLPEHVDIRPGIVASVAGEPVDRTGAAELSSEPRLLAGYPKVTNLTPTQAEAQFSGNKQGTIYYAVSELADGSVSEEHLVNNPAYGGIIYENNAGTIAAASKTVYSRDLTKLEPDVSYYLTAMLEDGRGNRSPIKVVSFTTPDNTKPEFLNGYISRQTCDVVQLTGMPNKSCTLYWVLLPAGAAKPTPQNFKSGTFGGHYGRGSMSVMKNVPVSIQVNEPKLQEDTDYDLYVWLNDFNGAQNSDVYHFPVHTPDETPPVVIRIDQTNFDLADAIEFNFAINEAPSTLYWAVVTESDEKFIPEGSDLNSQAIQIKVENGTKAGAIVSGGKAAAGAGVDTLVGSADFKNALKYATYKTHSFKLYYVAKDAYGNYSEVKYIVIHTKDAEEPTVTLSYTNPINDRVSADSDLILTFTEQVKGSNKLGAETFVDFYNEVLKNQDVGGSALTQAKKDLAKELSDHITLYYVERNGGEPGEPVYVVDPTSNSAPEFNGDGDTPRTGWVNWGEAIVELQPDGTVTLTLPAGKGVSLSSGMEYYFYFKNIYDNSREANRLYCLNNRGEKDGGGTDWDCRMAHFFTVYAQVTLTDKGESKATIKGQEGAADKTVYMDIVVEATPKSTSNIASDVYWDMIIWGLDSVMKVDLYRQVDQGDWTQIWKEVTLTGDGAGTGLDYRNNTGATYERTVEKGLVEGHTYRYGIHITHMGTSLTARDNEDARPQNWTADVNLRFSLVAGGETEVNNLGRTVDLNYDNYILNGTVNEIGLAYKTENGVTTEVTKLDCNRTYSDTRGPAIKSGPQLTPGSGSITISIGLDHSGWVYYMVAPADIEKGGVFTSTDGTAEINSSTDGSENNDQPVDEDGLTYIPISGGDAVTHQKNIYFKQNKAYTNPNYLEIVKRSAGAGRDTVQYGSHHVTSSTDPAIITVKNLKPSTNYYVYIVLGSDSDEYNEVMQIYRTMTGKAEPPAIEIGGATGTSVATMTTYNVENYQATADLYDNPELYYALWHPQALPDIFNKKICVADFKEGEKEYKKGDEYTGTTEGTGSTKVKTVIDAMMTPYGSRSGLSTFDRVAKPEMKEEVTLYIKGTIGMDADGKAPVYRSRDNRDYRNGVKVNPWDQNFADMMDQTSEYYLLACAKNADAEDKGEYWGFAAARGLTNRDNDPPTLSPKDNPPAYLLLEGRQANDSANTVWSGYLTVTFDKNIRYQPESTSGRSFYTITYADNSAADGIDETKGTISLKKIIGGSAIISNHASIVATSGNVTNSITFRIGWIRDNETIVLFTGGYIASVNGATTTKQLTLKFKSDIKGDNLAGASEPGFLVSWS